MVYVEGGNTPTFKHTTLGSAEIEAKRLCLTLNKPAIVLSSVKKIEQHKFDITDMTPDEMLPF